MATALLMLGGEFEEETLIRELAIVSSLIVAADSGAEHLRRLDIRPHAIIGDLDSITSETLRFYEKSNSNIIRISEQEHNDFEKSLRWIEASYTGEVHIFGLTGKRTDHTLSNLSVMLRYAPKFDRLVAHDKWGYHEFILPGNPYSVNCDPATLISLTPFGIAEGIVTKNLTYPLQHETLELGAREGLSNIATDTPVSISITGGALLVSVGRRN